MTFYKAVKQVWPCQRGGYTTWMKERLEERELNTKEWHQN